ncbi:hypothetical protein HanRHA438_Chr04g0170951 [Helianthus annuus]|nr:hypothetical protein HanHA300_Chr04g0132401 [Helianthus annuus]KAJ0596655.1 hypothetical protein HanHA89_Chr04g0145371 [Helianthus annuus]KAJ0757322.1 hypothetical protein HanLR1_Chr04g0137371 [Helianthus annuus]KAJ0761029.1 hypothetical protein HanOQP8_Chr04g0144971 [Helianthus annuus]KAJ0926419.1 hypothetical protein HanRHA438_Chr04g0170951 [Helianthus annuus]
MRKKAERDQEPANLRQPALRVLASHPQKRSKSSSLRFPARVPTKFWQFPVTSGEVPARFR